MRHFDKTFLTLIIFSTSILFSTVCNAFESKVNFSDYGNAFAEAAGMQDLKRDEAALMPVLNASYVAVKLGFFDVWHPREPLRDKTVAKNFKTAAGVLLDLQERWIRWVADDAVAKGALGDIKVLNKWVRSWKMSRMLRRKKQDEGRPDLLNILKVNESITEASKRFEEFMLKAEYMNRKERIKENVFILLAPTRKNFLELACFLGSLSDYNRNYLWKDSMASWTTFDCKDIQAISMEYPATVPGKGDIKQGVDMNVSVKTGLCQHVMLNAAEYLIHQYHQGSLSRELAKGFASNMVVDTYKEISVRSGGGGPGQKLRGYSQFVPGGSSTGGTLPGRKATPHESRWNKDKGKDYFLSVLRKAQKQGAKHSAKKQKKPGSKMGNFTLQSDSGVLGHTVRAPFFGIPAGPESIPPEYRRDFKDFYRAYQCAFAYWLRNKAESTASDQVPAELAKRFLCNPKKMGTGWLLKEVYGMPLTGKDQTTDSLEWRFLQWLAK
jgi:hypothetical protein